MHTVPVKIVPHLLFAFCILNLHSSVCKFHKVKRLIIAVTLLTTTTMIIIVSLLHFGSNATVTPTSYASATML
jgi:hypothetical protein